jgi:hypothetical protein
MAAFDPAGKTTSSALAKSGLVKAWNERRAAMEGKPVIPDFGGH